MQYLWHLFAQSHVKAGANPNWLRASCRVHCWSRQTTIHTCIHNYGQFRGASWSNCPIFKMWDKTRVLRGNPHRKQKSASAGYKPTAPLCCLRFYVKFELLNLIMCYTINDTWRYAQFAPFYTINYWTCTTTGTYIISAQWCSRKEFLKLTHLPVIKTSLRNWHTGSWLFMYILHV